MRPERRNLRRQELLRTPVGVKEFYLSIASGHIKGTVASLALNLLRPASYLYGGLLWTRSLLYRQGFFPVVRLPLPVISVGNITVGGTGKTPFTEFLVKFLTRNGKKVAILSRGYGGTNGMNDEAKEFREKLPGVPILLGKDRVANARMAIEKFHPQCLILDDGFQHLKIARDLDIVIIDSLEPFGTGNLIPAGTLREPMSSLRRAGLFVLSKTNLCAPGELQKIKAGLRALDSSTPIIETVHHPLYLEDMKGNRLETSHLNRKRILAFCGLGSPTSFEKTLRLLGANLVGFKRFPDHHLYSPEEEKGLMAETLRQKADFIVTTNKDRVKLQEKDWPTPLFSLRIEIRITQSQGALIDALRRILPW